MQASWFCREDRKLGYKDGRTVRIGITHKVRGRLKLCKNGLHASTRLIDALKYAPGPILYLVDLSGEFLSGEDKLCARERKYLASFNATDLLWRFARKQALISVEKIKPYTGQYDLIVRWLETGDESIRLAAWSAAESAAWSAARSAANEMLTRMVREETGWPI